MINNKKKIMYRIIVDGIMQPKDYICYEDAFSGAKRHLKDFKDSISAEIVRIEKIRVIIEK